jgi:hypothetical protein
MKFTSEDLLKAMGLKIGDVIKTSVGDIFEIVKDDFIYLYLKNDEGRATDWQSSYLINLEFEIITPKKKIGDMKCDEMLCRKCPLKAIDCDARGKTLYEALEIYRKHLNNYNGSLEPFEKTIIASIKAELDKEV